MTGKGDDASGRPIRFGIMCRGTTFAAWEAACIRNLLAIDGVDAALLIIDDSAEPVRSLKERLPGFFNLKTLLWRLYQRAVLNRKSRSTQPVDLSEELDGVPVVRCIPRQSGKWVQRFEPEDVEIIREHDLDFVLRFAFNILRGDVLESARYGIWSFHHGDPDIYRGTPPGFWEIYQRDPVTGTVLQRLTERLDAGVMLHKGWFKTDAASYARSRDNIFFGAADWPARLCRQLLAGQAIPSEAEASTTSAPIYRAPNSLQMMRFLWTSATAWVANQLNFLFRMQQWSVGIIDASVEQVAGLVGPEDTDSLVRSAKWLPEPKGRFLADPFAVATPQGLTILAEDFDWSIDRGHISTIQVGRDGAATDPMTAIRPQSHLSYPYLLKVGDEQYCIPEASESGEVALYRADAELRTWTKVATLVEGARIVDPTIFSHEGRWWLLGTQVEAGDNLKLFAWHATELSGPWQPHSANPIKTDIRSSRPAGPPFVYNGSLFRPAQDCSTGYGAAVVVNRIVRLTPDDFEEEAVSRIEPDPNGPYPGGLHTICGAGGRTVIDGARTAYIASATKRAIAQKFRRSSRKR